MFPTRVLKCAECGAALPSERGPAIACAYCGAVNQTDLTPPLAAVDVSPAGGEASARLDEVAPRLELPRATKALDRPAPPRARRSGLWTLAVFGLVSIVGFVLISPSARCVDWVSGPFCEIDANGDGRPDLAMKARRSGGEKLFALDGRGGAVRWSAGALSTSGDEMVFCAVHLAPTRTGVLIAGKRPDGHLRFAWVRASDGEVVYDRPLPEDSDSLNDVFGVMVDSADMAYVDVNSRLYAYDVQSGEARWHTGLF
jgi:hypothetical protein